MLVETRPPPCREETMHMCMCVRMCVHSWFTWVSTGTCVCLFVLHCKLLQFVQLKKKADLVSKGENWQRGALLTRTGHISNSQFGTLYPPGVNSSHMDIDQRIRDIWYTVNVCLLHLQSSAMQRQSSSCGSLCDSHCIKELVLKHTSIIVISIKTCTTFRTLIFHIVLPLCQHRGRWLPVKFLGFSF